MKIIFDFDGTLIDVWDRYFSVLRDYVRNNFDTDINKRDYAPLKKTLRRDDAIVEALIGRQLDVSDYSAFKTRNLEEWEYLRKDVLIDGTKETLADLRGRKIEIDVLSARRNADNFFKELSALGLSGSLDNSWIVAPGHGNKVAFLKDKLRFDDVVVGDGYEELDCVAAYGCRGFFVESGIVDCKKSYLRRHGIKKIKDVGALTSELNENDAED